MVQDSPGVYMQGFRYEQLVVLVKKIPHLLLTAYILESNSIKKQCNKIGNVQMRFVPNVVSAFVHEAFS